MIEKSSGQASKALLIIAAIVLVAIIIAFIVIRAAEKPPKQEEGPGGTSGQEVPKPVYEATMGDIKFTFQKATDRGKILKGSESRYSQWEQDLVTKEKFIEVSIGAQNLGKQNTEEKIWDIGEIIDSEGRNFVALGGETRSWLPEENECGATLKPGFAPVSCVKIYEAAEISTGLKIKVFLFDKPYSDQKQEALLDLIVLPQ